MSLMQRNFEVRYHRLGIKDCDTYDFLGPSTQTESHKARC